MSDGLKDILSNSNKDIDNQHLMDYLSNQLSKADQHTVEKFMADDDFINDAVEGLQEFDNTKNLPVYVEMLNNDLRTKLTKAKIRKDKRKWKDQPWSYLAIVAILLLLIIAFVIVKKYMDTIP